MNEVHARRSLSLVGCLVVWTGLIIGRLYYLQIIQYVPLMARADREQQRTVDIAPKRGIIYDRHMHPLAVSLAVNSVYAVPANIPDPSMEAKLLAPILNLDPKDLETRFKTYRTFCWVKRKITSQQTERIKALNLQGIYFQKEMKRFYPDGDLAATVLGFVGMDDKGLGGIEYGLNNELKGLPGKVLLSTDARHQSFRSTEWRGAAGKNVVLTIDQDIQFIAQKVLAQTVKKFHAAGGTVIVQNPHTGAILAMANQPTFNPNHFQKYPPVDRINRAVGWIYEPGSTFKLVTISAAIQSHVVTSNQVINCQDGHIVLAGHIIHDWHPFGDLSVAQILMHSSDIGTIKVALRLGQDRLYKYIQRFGFGTAPDVDLPGNECGLVRPPNSWSGIGVAEISIGQGIGVTPLQMAMAFSAIANGGVMVQPRIVKDVFQGSVENPVSPSLGRRIVTEQTANTMKQMLEGVVEHGTGVPAQLVGYTAGGKTGTAQKVGPNGRYSHKDYVASFIGFAPVDNPAITVLVVIDTPVGAIYGDQVAAPAWKSITQQTLRYLNVPQDSPTGPLQIASLRSAKSPSQKRRAMAANPPADSETAGAATRPVEPVSFSQASNSPPDGTVLLDEGPLLVVPNFNGLSARRVTEECQSLGLEMQMVGSGLAIQQNPLPGTSVHAGSTVWVRFAPQACCSVSGK